MTNAEKYLKDNVSAKEVAKKLTSQICHWDELSYERDTIEKEIVNFLNEQVKPILTEDERVILRNIKNEDFGEYIGRGDKLRVNVPTNHNLYLRGYDESKAYAIGSIYNHLFQFIKERRRIRDKGVVK